MQSDDCFVANLASANSLAESSRSCPSNRNTSFTRAESLPMMLSALRDGCPNMTPARNPLEQHLLKLTCILDFQGGWCSSRWACFLAPLLSKSYFDNVDCGSHRIAKYNARGEEERAAAYETTTDGRQHPRPHHTMGPMILIAQWPRPEGACGRSYYEVSLAARLVTQNTAQTKQPIESQCHPEWLRLMDVPQWQGHPSSMGLKNPFQAKFKPHYSNCILEALVTSSAPQSGSRLCPFFRTCILAARATVVAGN